MKRPQDLSVILLAALAASCLSLSGCGTRTAEAAQRPTGPKLIKVGAFWGVQMEPESAKLAGITVVEAGNENVSATLQPTGEVTSTDAGTVQMTSRLPGKIAEVFVSAGDRVRKGQVIAYVDSVDLGQAEAAYQTAVSHANLAKNQLDQQRKLAGFGSFSEQPLEDASRAAAASDAAVASDEAQIKIDKVALENTKQLVDMGEITHKPVEDAQNAFSQAQSGATQAAANLHSTKANLDRAKILVEGGVFSRQQYEDAETAYVSAAAAAKQADTAEMLAKDELNRQQRIYKQDLNGASSLQSAQSKVQQDEHTYQNDLVAQDLAHKQLVRARAVKKSGIPISQAIQQAQDAYEEAIIAVQGASNTLKLYGVPTGASVKQLQNGRVVIPLVSPINGLVATRNMVVGQNTDTATVLARVVNLDKVYVDAQIYEQDQQGVSLGDSVQIHVSAIPDRNFRGKVQWISNEVSQDTRSVTVRTVLDNPGWTLRPGMFANVLIGSKKSVKAISVPSDAVLQEGDKQVVYVQIAPGQYVKRTVKAKQAVAGRVPLESGVAEGDLVVIGGNVLIQKEQEKLEGGKSDSK